MYRDVGRRPRTYCIVPAHASLSKWHMCLKTWAFFGFAVSITGHVSLTLFLTLCCPAYKQQNVCWCPQVVCTKLDFGFYSQNKFLKSWFHCWFKFWYADTATSRRDRRVPQLPTFILFHFSHLIGQYFMKISHSSPLRINRIHINPS